MVTIHWLVFLLATAAQGSDVITCRVSSENVMKGEDVNVTCYFPYDVSQMTRIWVAIDLYSYNIPPGIDPERLVDCVKMNTPTFTCNATVGYSIDGEVKKDLTLKIKSVSAKHDGHFQCQIMPSNGPKPDTEPCHFSVEDAYGELTTSRTTTTVACIVTATIPVPDDTESHAEKETTNTGLIAAVVISNIFTVAAVVFAVIIAILWRRSVKKRKETNGRRDSVAAPPDEGNHENIELSRMDGRTENMATEDSAPHATTPLLDNQPPSVTSSTTATPPE